MGKEFWNATLKRSQGRIHIFRYPEVKSLCGKGPPGFVPFPGDTHSIGKVLWAAWKSGRLCKLCEKRARGMLAERG